MTMQLHCFPNFADADRLLARPSADLADQRRQVAGLLEEIRRDGTAALRRLALPQVIVTNASRGWAARALSHLGLKDFFPDDMIIPIEDVDFQPKAYSRVPFEAALSRMGVAAESTLMVDDMPAKKHSSVRIKRWSITAAPVGKSHKMQTDRSYRQKISTGVMKPSVLASLH